MSYIMNTPDKGLSLERSITESLRRRNVRSTSECIDSPHPRLCLSPESSDKKLFLNKKIAKLRNYMYNHQTEALLWKTKEITKTTSWTKMIWSLFYPYYQLTLFGVTFLSYLPIFKILPFWIRPRAVHALSDLSSEFHTPEEATVFESGDKNRGW